MNKLHGFSGFRIASRALGALLLLCLNSAAQAQWTVTYLNNGELYSVGYGASGLYPVGQVGLSSAHASFWSSSGTSWVDLNPEGALLSVARGGWEAVQVGEAFVNGFSHASLWYGTADSWVDLNPVGYYGSVALAASSTKQAGYTLMGSGVPHASLWSGTSASWVDLNPAGADWSQALCTLESGSPGGSTQVGYARVASGDHAFHWNGTAASALDIHPFDALYSIARGISGSVVVGEVDSHAAAHINNLGYEDLQPFDAVYSSANAISSAGNVVGYAAFGDHPNFYPHAYFWGSDSSRVDLHALLSADFHGLTGRSVATATWNVGGYIFVVGYAWNDTLGRNEAVMWSNSPHPHPQETILPNALYLFRGALLSGDVEALKYSDDVKVIVATGTTGNPDRPVRIDIDGTTTFTSLSEIEVTVESHASIAGIRQWIEAYNFNTSVWDVLDVRAMGTSDSTVTLIVPSPDDHLGPGSTLRLRVSFRELGKKISGWEANVDQVGWKVRN